mmetsp:Transcript_122602/g.354355  ORF Transcript_122602/g.354355 Transcript_122602/m.354355 type:complete len:152 (+) Transcript_122602:196-651(+)
MQIAGAVWDNASPLSGRASRAHRWSQSRRCGTTAKRQSSENCSADELPPGAGTSGDERAPLVAGGRGANFGRAGLSAVGQAQAGGGRSTSKRPRAVLTDGSSQHSWRNPSPRPSPRACPCDEGPKCGSAAGVTSRGMATQAHGAWRWCSRA